MVETREIPGSELGEVDITREFDAPRAMVFRAFMEPEQLIRFWGPPGTSVPLASVIIEPWVGGRFENVIVSDDSGDAYPFRSVFLEIVEPERFTFREVESGLISASTFTDLGTSRTRVEIHQTNVPLAYRSPEALAGFLTTLDLLAAHLAARMEDAS
jgi:uncharacterized protein YndB with AHSA1/START domain